MQDEVKVTQADIDAWEIFGPKIFHCEMTGPDALARHRHQAERETLARMEPVAPRYRHKKRGTVYEVVGTAELQVAGLAPDEGDYLEVYRGDDGKLWARPFDEFHDGRFEALPPAPEAGQ